VLRVPKDLFINFSKFREQYMNAENPLQRKPIHSWKKSWFSFGRKIKRTELRKSKKKTSALNRQKRYWSCKFIEKNEGIAENFIYFILYYKEYMYWFINYFSFFNDRNIFNRVMRISILKKINCTYFDQYYFFFSFHLLLFFVH
jgi:hypothetical protein